MKIAHTSLGLAGTQQAPQVPLGIFRMVAQSPNNLFFIPWRHPRPDMWAQICLINQRDDHGRHVGGLHLAQV